MIISAAPNVTTEDRYYVGHFYAVYLPPTSAAIPSAADVEPRATTHNLPSFTKGIVITFHQVKRIFKAGGNVTF